MPEPAPEHLTEQQKKWFASVKANLEAETGRTMDEWVAIARTCPHDKPRARTDWMKEHHGLGINRASVVMGQAFPTRMGWDEPSRLRETLWSDPASRAIFEAVEALVKPLPDLVTGQRKGFSAWSSKYQFAAIKPVKGGTAVLGLAVPVDADPRLAAPKNEGWSERLTAKLALASPAEADDRVLALLNAAWGLS